MCVTRMLYAEPAVRYKLRPLTNGRDLLTGPSATKDEMSAGTVVACRGGFQRYYALASNTAPRTSFPAHKC